MAILVAKVLKAIHVQKSKKAAREKVKTVVEGTAFYKAERGCKDGGGRHRRNADLL